MNNNTEVVNMMITQSATCPNNFLSVSKNPVTVLFKTGIAAFLLFLVACSTTPQPPYLALQSAESAIDNADQERVSDYALPELREARDKLTAARAAVQQEEMDLAKNLADESRVSAELASAKAERIKAAEVNNDMKKGTLDLRQEMQRMTGER